MQLRCTAVFPERTELNFFSVFFFLLSTATYLFENSSCIKKKLSQDAKGFVPTPTFNGVSNFL